MGRHKLDEKLFEKNQAKSINNFTDKIVNIFPILKSEYNIDIFSDRPVSQRPTAITYTGNDSKKTRILLEFNSNYRENNVDLLQDNEVFCTVFYGFAGNKAGVLNLDDSNECAEIIYSALYELGFRTQQDIDKAKQDEENKKQAEIEAEREKNAKKKEQLKKDIENQPNDNSDEELNTDSEESEDSINEASTNYDKYLAALIKRNELGSKIFVSITLPNNNSSYKVLSIELTFISAKMCLVETSGINPKVDKTTTWENAKDYIFKVVEKVNGVISLEASTAEGKDIDISEESQDSDVNVDIDI